MSDKHTRVIYGVTAIKFGHQPKYVMPIDRELLLNGTWTPTDAQVLIRLVSVVQPDGTRSVTYVIDGQGQAEVRYVME